MNTATTPLEFVADTPLPIFGTRDDVLAQAHPIGRARADAILRRHPRAPRPVLGGGRPGSKEIFSLEAGREFWLDVARNGVPEGLATQ